MRLSGRLLCIRVQFSLALTLSFCAEAQQGQPPEPTIPQITVKVNEVIVPVVVRNAQGESVGTLTKEDFQVFDDGKLQTLTGFSVTEHTGESNPAVAPALTNNGSPVAPQPPSQAERSVVYVFDDLNMSGSELTQAKQAASKLFETSLPVSDTAAVASTSGSNTGLTRDHSKLQQAIRNLKAQSTYRSNPLDCPNIDYYQSDLILNKGDGAALAAAISDAMICAGLTDGAGHEAVAAQSAQQAAHRAVDMGERDFRSNIDGPGGGSRTHTGSDPRQILSLLRLPVPPLRENLYENNMCGRGGKGGAGCGGAREPHSLREESHAVIPERSLWSEESDFPLAFCEQ